MILIVLIENLLPAIAIEGGLQVMNYRKQAFGVERAGYRGACR